MAKNFPGLLDPVDAEAAKGEGPRRDATVAGRDKVQLRHATALTFEAYVTGRGWEEATLPTCPVCGSLPTRHGTYGRKLPTPARIARFYCAPCGMTIGVLPDFYASRKPGLLADIEDTVAVAEQSRSMEAAAEQMRPAEEDDAVTFTSAVRWMRRRVDAIHRVLATVIGLLPARFEGCAPTVTSFRERLGTTCVLVELREICARYLRVLAAPLGLVSAPGGQVRPRRRLQQSTGPDPPAASP